MRMISQKGEHIDFIRTIELIEAIFCPGIKTFLINTGPFDLLYRGKSREKYQ